MFARLRNLFSKTKYDMEVDSVTEENNANSSYESTEGDAKSFVSCENGTSEDTSKLEGLNVLKSIVESEQQSQSGKGLVVENGSNEMATLSEEMEELLEKRLSKDEDQLKVNGDESDENNKESEIVVENIENSHETKEMDKPIDNSANTKQINESQQASSPLANNENEEINSYEIERLESSNDLEIIEEVERFKATEASDVSSQIREATETSDIENPKKTEIPIELFISDNESISEDALDSCGQNVIENIAQLKNPEETVVTGESTEEQHKQVTLENNESQNEPLNTRDNSPEFSESSKSLSQSSVKENPDHSTSPSPLQATETNISNHSSIVVEDTPSEITAPSPTVDSAISGSSSSNTSTLDKNCTREFNDPTKIVVNPIDSNRLACNAINNKLTDIAEVAESLDAIIREAQANCQTEELDSNPSPSDKKLGTLRSTSSEDWHSRSTEDDSFATASEGNFTPHSHSSASFQTASGRTSSYISCDKNSFDASEADDSAYAFDMPELTSPLNMSFEGSEQSYLSAQPNNSDVSTHDKEKTLTKLSESGFKADEDQSSIADIEELHSESVTPTPEEHYEGYHVDSIPVESETELEVAGLAEANAMRILTEHTALPLSRTPEVSATNSNVCSNQNPPMNQEADSNDQQEQENTNNNSNNKPNTAWRRSKYYENITKQTIKGFL